MYKPREARSNAWSDQTESKLFLNQKNSAHSIVKLQVTVQKIVQDMISQIKVPHSSSNIDCKGQALDGKLVQRSVGVEQDLGVTINSLVELVVSIDSLVNVNFVRNDERGLSTARDDEVAELTVVGLDVALACTEVKTLLEELAEGDEDLSLGGLRVWSTRVLFAELAAVFVWCLKRGKTLTDGT